MSYINFSPAKLTNLEFTSEREIIRSNRAGSYIYATLNGCNTRKYHGLLVCPVTNFGSSRHILLSALDESLVCKESVFNLAVRRFQGGYFEPKGNKYLQKFELEKVPRYIYRTGNVVLIKEMLLVEKEQQLLVRYTLEAAPSPVMLQLRPFLAFRNIHELSKTNLYAQTHYTEESNGISLRLYDGYPGLYLQVSRENEFIAAPDWYYNIEYTKEKNRGYEFLEDLYTPGFFEITLKQGEPLIFSCSTSKGNPAVFKQRFSREVNRKISCDSLSKCLENAANQFIQYRDDSAVDIIAGFPWYNSITRQTFISLPGLRHALGERRMCPDILSTYLPYLKKGLFPGSIAENPAVYNSADASLWFIWTIQKLKKQHLRFGDSAALFMNAVKEILENYKKGTSIVSMLENGLLFAAEPGIALTWMNSYCRGKPAVPRYGKPVELNALWYNAVCFALELAQGEKDTEFLAQWREMPHRIAKSFLKTFWCDEKEYLADVETGLYTDWSVRPNMVIAAAMPYTPLNMDQREKIIDVARHQLLTPRGLRSLSPDDQYYIGTVDGSQDMREEAAYNGAAYPWLIQFFAEAALAIYKKSGVTELKKIIEGFESEMTENCIGTISEMYNGSPPYSGKGAVSQAWNVAALFYTMYLITEMENE